MRVRPLLGIFTLLAIGIAVVPAQADGPGVGAPYVVSVGDSYISGEAGRWAGNTNNGEAVPRRRWSSRLLRQRQPHG
ncbi:MAG: hypothetical protein JWM40_313 [Frankiales bacterium]|nr:hypothetical protein [Frankiales bacterium]